MSHLTARVYVKHQAITRSNAHYQFRNLSDFYINQFTFQLQDIAHDDLDAAVNATVNEVKTITEWVWGGNVNAKCSKRNDMHWNITIKSNIDGISLSHQVRIEFVAKPATVINAQLQSLILLTQYNNQLLQSLVQNNEQIPPEPELPNVKKPKKNTN